MPLSSSLNAQPSEKSLLLFVLLGWLFMAPASLWAQAASDASTEDGDRLVAEYFRLETEKLSVDVAPEGMSLDELKEQQAVDRRQLAEMLGLDPMPKRTPLEPVIVSSETRDGFRFERLHFQPSPGLYVAANFYLPLTVDEPLPTILYVCGHAHTAKDGVRPGNKAAYHHHGVWFARHGYACLIIDTIQLGEFAGEHHGTYRLGKWWWNNRGYTPAGVEAWTGIRALDYLESRKEVDPNRFGITGRSGGGVYSWWVTALDPRIKVAVPVAGITSLKNHVVDGCVEGHCDCMYMVNTYRWDYDRVASLVAPRPLLISNSDKDKIFPLDGVIQVHRRVRDVYERYGKPDHLGLQITEGPHKDTQELRVHAFRWFNRFLKNDDSLISTPAEKYIDYAELAVFEDRPEDERVTSVDVWFVPEVQQPKGNWQETLRQQTFGGWPSEELGNENPVSAEQVAESVKDGIRCQVVEFDSQTPYRLPLFVLSAINSKPSAYTVEVLGQDAWERVAGGIASIVPEYLTSSASAGDVVESLAARVMQNPDRTLVLFPPRGVGPTEWTRNPTKQTHIRRRFMLLGQTLDGMRIWDVRRAVAAVRSLPAAENSPITLQGTGHAAAWALYASLFDQPISKLELKNLPTSHRDGITLLNVSRIVDMPTVIELASSRAKLTLSRIVSAD